MKIFEEIKHAIKQSTLVAESQDGEGRVNSKLDEKNIILILKEKFPNNVIDTAERMFADVIIVADDGTRCHTNIKTSIGGSDNAFSKLGFLMAFTDITEEELADGSLGGKFDSKIDDQNFVRLMEERKKDTPRDYYFLALDKNNMTAEPIIRGVKEIENWGWNTTNNAQIVWEREKNSSGKSRTFDEAYDEIIKNGVYRCWRKKADQWAQAIEISKK